MIVTFSDGANSMEQPGTPLHVGIAQRTTPVFSSPEADPVPLTDDLIDPERKAQIGHAAMDIIEGMSEEDLRRVARLALVQRLHAKDARTKRQAAARIIAAYLR